MLDAAAKLFAEKGYEATSIGEIAESVGLLKGSLYYYAPSKEDLLFSIICEVHDKGRKLVERFTESAADPVTQLREIIEAGATFVIDHRDMNIISMRDFRALTERRQQELESGRMVMWHYLRNLITRGRNEGYFRSDVDVVVVTTGILGAINYLPTWYESGRPPKAERMARGYEFSRGRSARAVASASKGQGIGAALTWTSVSISAGAIRVCGAMSRKPPTNMVTNPYGFRST